MRAGRRACYRQWHEHIDGVDFSAVQGGRFDAEDTIHGGRLKLFATTAIYMVDHHCEEACSVVRVRGWVHSPRFGWWYIFIQLVNVCDRFDFFVLGSTPGSVPKRDCCLLVPRC